MSTLLPKRMRRVASVEALMTPVGKESENEATSRIEKKYLARAVTPLKAIRAKCVQCQGGQVKQVAKCTAKDCALWPFRMEKNTFHPNTKTKTDL